MIACIGWGSLIWDPAGLPVSAPWRTDGPVLPLEFARQSKGDRVTLVIVPNALPSPTFWAPFNTGDLSIAREALRLREGKTRDSWIGQWTRDVEPEGEITRVIGAWAAAKYVRRAPLQIRTAYRRTIEERLGWTATST